MASIAMRTSWTYGPPYSAISPEGRLGQRRGSLLITLFACMLLLGLSMYSLLLADSASLTDLSAAYYALAVEGAVFSVLVLVKYGRSGIYLFEPFTIITLVMVLVYLVAPIFQFAAGSTARYGVDVVDYCVPASSLVMLGYFTFFLGYEFPLGRKRNRQHRAGVGFTEPQGPLAEKLGRWCYWIWAGAYLLNLFYYLRKGFNLVYIITGGLSGAETNDFLAEESLAFLAYSKFLLLGAWIVIYAYGENKAIKVVLYALTLLCMLLGGGRATLLIGILAPVVLYFARNKKSPKGSSVIIALLALIALFAFMQVARTGIRTGSGIDMAGVSLDELLNPFYAEIDDFKSFYALLGTVPSKHDFLYGSQMIGYSLVLLVPRAIFPAKPYPSIYDLVYLSLGDQAVLNGNAYPAIGEYYVEFGIVGVVVCMWLLGVISRRLTGCYLYSKGKSLAMLAYAIVYPSLFSFVIRGYMPQNFTMVLFLLMPLVVCRLLQNCQGKNEERRV